VILFISPSNVEDNHAADWAELSTQSIPRQCPECLNDSVIGHGRRRKQAHDEDHDWIRIRRGLCNRCRKTITFLPLFSLPYTHYSLIARSEALKHYFVEGCSLEVAAPLVKDPNRIPAASTLRRWFSGLDSPQRCGCLQQTHPGALGEATAGDSRICIGPSRSFPFLHKMLMTVSNLLARGEIFRYSQLVLSWRTVAHFLHVLLPLRI
jgi:Domain of unknown function (DUF6431)